MPSHHHSFAAAQTIIVPPPMTLGATLKLAQAWLRWGLMWEFMVRSPGARVGQLGVAADVDLVRTLWRRSFDRVGPLDVLLACADARSWICGLAA